jgi:integrase/recombinase XerC
MSRRGYAEPLSVKETLSLEAFVELATRQLERNGGLAGPSVARLTQLQGRFSQFLTNGLGVGTADRVLPEHVRAFVESRTRDGRPPSIATMHLRRSAVRLLYREARSAGLTDSDPARNLHLPARSSLRTRPLTDDEVALCRSSSVKTLSDTRQPAAFAFAEATARCAEMPAITVEDLDLERARVWLKGTSATVARWAHLTPWGADQVARRIARLTAASTTRIICPKSRTSSSAAASAHRAVAEVLRRAGLSSEPDVRPNSIVAWRGTKALAEGAGIEKVAVLLGVRSLDRAALLIGWDWQEGGSL